MSDIARLLLTERRSLEALVYQSIDHHVPVPT